MSRREESNMLGVCDGKDKAFSVVQRSDYLCVLCGNL
jgi:hypothetical protein